MKIGCHAVLFRERIKSHTEEILKGIAAAGFQGFEMGARFFGTDDGEYLKGLLEKYGLELAGMHIGCPLKVWAETPDENLQKVLAAARFLRDMPNKNIIMSGSDFSGGNVQEAARNIEKAAVRCSETGVRLHYHNHDWEFLNGAGVYKALRAFAPGLYFALDLGWVYKGGCEPISLIRENADRISYLHLRDPKEKSGREFPELGEGLFDYAKLMKAAEEVLGKEGWAVVEYETGPEDPGRYAKARKFLEGLGY